MIALASAETVGPLSPWNVLMVLWLAAPVIVAAIVHIVVIKVNALAWLKRPIDGGRSWRGHRIFGDNKTWRGALVMTAVSTAVAPLQGIFRLPSLEYFDYGATPMWLAGLLLGLGFVLFELPNSFSKRMLGVAPGGKGSPFFVLLDQVDSVVGCMVLLCGVWVAPLHVWLWVLVLCSGVHMLLNGVFVLVGLKERVF